MTLLPGVVSKNTTVLVSRDASAEEGQARLVRQDVGLVFSMASSRADGPAQAARNMVELATVELVGRLIKAPYWQCLGLSDSDPEVQREMDDWYLSMDEGERIRFFKERMRESRYYDGDIDDKDDASFQQALRAYRQAMGLKGKGVLDEQFFRQFVTQAVPKKARLVSAHAQALTHSDPVARPAPAASQTPATPPMNLSLFVGANTAGKSAGLDVRVNTTGYVYCYSQDAVSGRIQRIFPNRFQSDPRLIPGKPLRLPGRGRFALNAAAQYGCIHAPQEIYADLPPPLRWGDFEDIRLNSFEDIQQHFAKASGLDVQLVRQVLQKR